MPGKMIPRKVKAKRYVKGSVIGGRPRPMSGAEYDRSRSGANTLGPNFAANRRATGGKVYDPTKVGLFNMSGYIGEYKDVYKKLNLQTASKKRKKV